MELKKKIEESDISFIFPDHLKLLDKNFIELTVAIDCLHEMDKPTIKYYLDQADNFSKNFYLKVLDGQEI